MSTHNVYADAADLAGQGIATGPTDPVDLALVLGSAWVRYHLGLTTAADDDVDVEDPIVLVKVPAPAAYRLAAVVAASRFLRSPDAPFGVLGGLGDLAVRVREDIPEAATILLGHRETFGVA